MKKNVEELMVEVKLLLLHHPEVHLPLLLLFLPLDKVGLLLPLSNQPLYSEPCEVYHNQTGALSLAQSYA